MKIIERYKNNWSENEILSPLVKRKFDKKIIEQIRKEKESGITNQILSEKYNCDQAVIINIVHHRGAYKD